MSDEPKTFWGKLAALTAFIVAVVSLLSIFSSSDKPSPDDKRLSHVVPRPSPAPSPPITYSRAGWAWFDPSKAYSTYGYSPRTPATGTATYCCATNDWERVCAGARATIGTPCKCPNVMALVDFVFCP
jgi:hypothetical protein